ncbi:hypothetical protein [Breoghania sp.]|uniref:hypothetical protein n=1 Tax=Breoghania sp. TaxID=2065378 RepID=UPI0026261FEE|nr:hypothetical protein [Breoghania sp.]MDJ0932386.1 hypothetical protein [Breoghania sp.]
MSGAQGIWFLVKTSRLTMLSPRLLPIEAWSKAIEYESRRIPGEHRDKWTIVHPWFKVQAARSGRGGA